jgi:hypothetical protein
MALRSASASPCWMSCSRLGHPLPYHSGKVGSRTAFNFYGLQDNLLDLGARRTDQYEVGHLLAQVLPDALRRQPLL